MASEIADSESNMQRQFRRAIADCVRLHRATLTPAEWSTGLHDSVDVLRLLLGQIWGAFARIYAARTKNWIADQDNPGYLIRKAQHAEVRVPYHLAPDFPDDGALDDLVDLALKVRVGGKGVICLSGSSTFLAALRIVADVDFCEYFIETTLKQEESLKERLRALSKTSSERLVCTEVKVYNRKGEVISLEIAQDVVAIFRAKVRFLALLAGDIVETTNLVLQSSGGSTDPSLRLSHAAQEAPIVNGSWIPQELLDPLSIGRYVDWLLAEVRSKLKTDLIKAAKRGLSLARITGYAKHGDGLISILQNGVGLLEAAIDARAELLPVILEKLQSNPNIGRPLMSAFRRTKKKLNKEIRVRRLRARRHGTQTESMGVNDLRDALASLLRDVSEAVS